MVGSIKLFWSNLGVHHTQGDSYSNSVEHKADLTNLHMRATAYQHAIETQHLEKMLSAKPKEREAILQAYKMQTDSLEGKSRKKQSKDNVSARIWAYDYTKRLDLTPLIKIKRDDAAEQERQEIMTLIEERKEKLYQKLAANPENSKQILADYDHELSDLEKSIAAKKASWDKIYTESKAFENDATKLNIGDQAYKQVYLAVTGEQQLPWEKDLDKQISKRQKTRAWIQLTLDALNMAKPHLEKAVQAMPITHKNSSSEEIKKAPPILPSKQTKIPQDVGNSSKVQSEQKDAKLVTPIISVEPTTLSSPIKIMPERQQETVKTGIKPGLPIMPVVADDQSPETTELPFSKANQATIELTTIVEALLNQEDAIFAYTDNFGLEVTIRGTTHSVSLLLV